MQEKTKKRSQPTSSCVKRGGPKCIDGAPSASSSSAPRDGECPYKRWAISISLVSLSGSMLFPASWWYRMWGGGVRNECWGWDCCAETNYSIHRFWRCSALSSQSSSLPATEVCLPCHQETSDKSRGRIKNWSVFEIKFYAAAVPKEWRNSQQTPNGSSPFSRNSDSSGGQIPNFGNSPTISLLPQVRMELPFSLGILN